MDRLTGRRMKHVYPLYLPSGLKSPDANPVYLTILPENGPRVSGLSFEVASGGRRTSAPLAWTTLLIVSRVQLIMTS